MDMKSIERGEYVIGIAILAAGLIIAATIYMILGDIGQAVAAL